MKSFKTLSHSFEAEMTERRSVFLGYACPVSSEAEALEFIAKIKKRHSDATHNVYAYILRGSISRFSDDGEPHGTAGLPVLEVLRKEGITDAVIVVTRYFGGILLGAGGLVRAYSAAAKLALDGAEVKECKPHTQLTFSCSYGDFQKLTRILDSHNVTKPSTDYSDSVLFSCYCPQELFVSLAESISNATGGRCTVQKGETLFL